jgi:PhoD-like phosphatase
MHGMAGQGITRREAVAAGAAAGAAVVAGRVAPAIAQAEWMHKLDFAALGSGDGWPGWTCAGAANLRRDGHHGMLEAATDVFPSDPRPVAFALDQRFRDGEIRAVVTSGGAGAGLVLRRTGPRDYYAAILEDEQRALLIVHRSGSELFELAREPVPASVAPIELAFAAAGDVLTATIASGVPVTATARGVAQPIGDPGVLATARTLWPSAGPSAFPALGNLHLLPYGVQEGEAFMQTAIGEELLATIRERSTAVFESIILRSSEGPRPTKPAVVAATGATPFTRGARLRVASDVPARVEIEFATNRAFRRSRRVNAGTTNDFNAVLTELRRLTPGRRVWWRARLRRRGQTSLGPVRSFRALPARGDRRAQATIAIGACASQFGPSFDQIAARHPDVFIWQGDLNYPDTMGPLAQTVPGYAGIWRDFLANPRMDPIFAGVLFAAQRDDHDYGVQDANSTNVVPHGLEPWEHLIGDRLYYRFTTGLAEFWVLDQRRFKSDPQLPDNADKTLLGRDQRDWLLRTLAASRARFKVVCSPCTLAPLGANARDGSWATGFTAERDMVLKHVREHVSGRTLFVTGDTHWTMAYERGGLFELRPCPLGIPTPNDITLTSPNAAEDARKEPGVLYADDDKGHFALVELSGTKLSLSMVREDGQVPFSRQFDQ